MIRKSILEKIKGKQGAALITVVVIFLTLVVIVTSATYAALGNFKRSVYSATKSSAYYIAEAGLFEIDQEVVSFFNEYKNKENPNFAQGFVDAFYDKIKSSAVYVVDEENGINLTYDKVMNQTTTSQVILSRDVENSTAEKQVFMVKSTGFVGHETRTVQKMISINVKEATISEAISPQFGGNVAIRPSTGPSTPFKFPGKTNLGLGYAVDTLVTNEPVLINTNDVGKLAGPIVTNNIIHFNASWPLIPWEDGTIITSDLIKIDQPLSSLKIRAIFFKPKKIVASYDEKNGYTYNLDYSSTYIDLKASNIQTSDVDVKYIFIPNGVDENQFFRLNGVPNADVKARFTSTGSKIIRYEPLNFDPYRDSTSPSFDVNFLVGADPNDYAKDDPNRPKLDYRDYFDKDFVLDNMHREEIVNKYNPKVKLPDIETFVEMYPIQNQVPKMNFPFNWGTIGEIDGKGNFKAHFPGTINLAAIAQSYGSNTLVFDSVSLGFGWPADALLLDVGDQDIVIVTKTLELKESLKVTGGKGSLEIVVVGSTPGAKLNQSDLKINYIDIRANKASQFRVIVYESSTPITVTSSSNGKNFTFGGTLFSKNLNIDINTAFTGNFISESGTSIRFPNVAQSSGTQLIYAPNAHFFIQGGSLTGVVVAKSYEFGYAAPSFIFDPSFLQSLLDEIDSPVFDFGEGGSGSGGDLSDILGELDYNSVIQEVDR